MSQHLPTPHHDELPDEARARAPATVPGVPSGPSPEQLFRNAVEQAPDAIVLVDRDGRIRLWNSAAQAVFGFSKDEALGKRVDLIVPDHLRSAHWQGFHRAMASGHTKYERHPLTTLARHKSDGPRYVELTFSIVKEDGAVVGAMAVARDVTARHLAESKLRQQAIELAFISLDNEWRVTFLNEAAQLLLGAEPLGRSFWDAFPTVIGTQLYDDFYRSVAEQQPVHHESFVPALGGWIEAHAYPSPVGLGIYVRSINQRKHLEKELGRSEERLRLFVQRVYDYAIVFCDVDGRVTSWNVGAERMYRYPAEEIVGKHYAVFFPEEAVRAGRPEAILTQARTTGRCEEEACRIRKDGSRFWADAIVTPLVEADGEFHGFSIVTRDMTERKAAEEALRKSAARVRRLVESNVVAVNIEDGAGHVLEANDAFLRLLGYTRGDLERGGIDCSRIIALEQLEAHRSAIEEARRTGVAPIRERQYVRSDGSRVDTLIGRATLEEDDRFVTFILDISDRKQLELQRARLLEESEAAVVARDEFLSIATHELRTPLTSLNLQLQMLERAAKRGVGGESAGEAGTADVSPATQLRFIESCERQTKRLTDLLNELLDLTRIRLGRLQLAPEVVDLVGLARDVVERLMPSAKRAGSSVTVNADVGVAGRWDPLRLEQVVTNLVSNAIKYGQGRPIDVSVAARPERGIAELSVRDQGMGIPPEMHARIFDRFERAYEGRAIAGLGLGLYIVRQIVQAHGGSVHVESELGKGSTFVVELPLGSDARAR